MAATHATSNGWRDVSLVRWVRGHATDIAILVALAAVAGTLRLVLLTDIPPGLHGDEAWTGIDARRILSDGWIGPYVGSAAGQPAGVLYLTAPFVRLFGETIFALRVVSALVGTATVLLAYLAFRTMFDRVTGAFAGILLAIGLWHLHFSRIAFTLIAWPLAELVTLWFLFLGLKTKEWRYFGFAGCALGIGVYTYNAYATFIAALGAFLIWLLASRAISAWRRRDARLFSLFTAKVALMAAVAFLVALPMILYAFDSSNDYRYHFDRVSVLETRQWERASFTAKADIVGDRYRDFLDTVYWSGRPDYADGAGENAMVTRVTLGLAVVGVLILIWRWRRPASVAVLLMALVIPLGSVLTVNGMYRRSFGLVPFIALLAAVPLSLAWRWAASLPSGFGFVPRIAVAAALAAIAFLNLNYYFGEFRSSDVALGTFGPSMTEAADFIDTLPDSTFVYFYSSNWGFSYETRRFLAPGHVGEDRAPPFRQDVDLNAEYDGDIAYVFTGTYLNLADEVADRYPRGTLIEGERTRAFLLPVSARPLVQDPSELRDRDATRVASLTIVGRALAFYQRQTGHYPDTSSRVETLCAVASDAACELEQADIALPVDPLGNGVVNGYWYESDGQSYRLYAQRESDTLPECLDHPASLDQFESLLCLTGP